MPRRPLRNRSGVAQPKGTRASSDRNGPQHECLAEAINTTYNILILLYPVTEWTATTVPMTAAATSIEPTRGWNPTP